MNQLLDLMGDYLAQAKAALKDVPVHGVKVYLYADDEKGVRMYVAARHDVDNRFADYQDKAKAAAYGEVGSPTIEDAVRVLKEKIADYAPKKEKVAKEKVTKPPKVTDIRLRDKPADYETLKKIFEGGPLRYKAFRIAIHRRCQVSVDTAKSFIAYWLEDGMVVKEGKARSLQAVYMLGKLPVV